MNPQVFWIETPWPGKIAIMPRPRSGDWLADEVRACKGAGLDIIVSMLTSEEIAELGLVDESLDLR
jgi:hypothetical protein